MQGSAGYRLLTFLLSGVESFFGQPGRVGSNARVQVSDAEALKGDQ